jgi:hypothetical protein
MKGSAKEGYRAAGVLVGNGKGPTFVSKRSQTQPWKRVEGKADRTIVLVLSKDQGPRTTMLLGTEYGVDIGRT